MMEKFFFSSNGKHRIINMIGNCIPRYISKLIESLGADKCTSLFLTLFTIEAGGNNPKSPFTDEWINKMYL